MLEWGTSGEAWPHSAASRFVEVDDLRWHVQRMGSGPLALLLHGTGLGGYSWAPLVDRLADRFSFVVPDLPGHAFSSLPGALDGLAPARMAVAVGRLLEILGLQPRLIVGHSAGAAIGSQLVLAGVAASAFVGINPAILLRPDLRSMPFWPALEWSANRPALALAAARFCADRRRFAFALRRLAPALSPESIERHHRVLLHPDQQRAAFGLMARWDVRALRAALPRFPVPALLLAGELDAWFPPRLVRALADEFRDAEVAVIPGTGHLSHEEDPDLVASRLLGFSRRVGIVG